MSTLPGWAYIIGAATGGRDVDPNMFDGCGRCLYGVGCGLLVIGVLIGHWVLPIVLHFIAIHVR